MIHILQTQNDFVQSVLDAAENGGSIKSTFPKKAKVGDEALVYSGSYGFLGRAKILSPAEPADGMGWPGRYGGNVGEIRLFEMFVPLDCIRSEMPGFAWARYPRNYTTPDPGTAAQLLNVIADFQHDNLDFVPDSLSIATEGARRLVFVNSYERSHKAREDCKRIHGTTCIACGFDFGAAYGTEFHGYIHVHHLRSLADINEEYVVDAKADLVPVCPNCHAVIHSRNPPYTIEEIRAFIQQVST